MHLHRGKQAHAIHLDDRRPDPNGGSQINVHHGLNFPDRPKVSFRDRLIRGEHDSSLRAVPVHKVVLRPVDVDDPGSVAHSRRTAQAGF